ncbi:MAG: hypothetical protein PVI25_03985 [Gammaproteobacteria bacterium]
MWSKRFERPFALRPADPAILVALAAVTWLPASLLVIHASIADELRGLLALCLAGAAALEIRDWRRRPAIASWAPGRGWSLEWADGKQRSARLLDTSRVFPWLLVLCWSLDSGRRVNLVFLSRRGQRTELRRIRVLLRHGRANG